MLHLVERIAASNTSQMQGRTRDATHHATALPSGNLNGSEHGATISLIFDHPEPGQGPRLHQHPSDETRVVIGGNISFQADDQQLQAGPGDIVIVPSPTPHKFMKDGPNRADLVCIYASPTFETECSNDRQPVPPQTQAARQEGCPRLGNRILLRRRAYDALPDGRRTDTSLRAVYTQCASPPFS